MHHKRCDGLNTVLPAIGLTTFSNSAKHHIGRSHIIRLTETDKNTIQASVSFFARKTTRGPPLAAMFTNATEVNESFSGSKTVETVY